MTPRRSSSARDRMSTDTEFRNVFRHKARASDRIMVVYVGVNDRGQSRLGVRVNRRVGGAVVRNRIRRRLREAFRRRRAELPVGLDIVCAIRPGGAYGFNALADSLVRLTAKASRTSRHSRRAGANRSP